MPKKYSEIIASYDAGNIMDWTNAINRLNGIPLDPTSIHNSYNDAIKYAANSPVAYVGQIITADDNIYIIVENPLGKHTIDGEEYDVYIKKISFDENIIVEGMGVPNELLNDDLDSLREWNGEFEGWTFGSEV